MIEKPSRAAESTFETEIDARKVAFSSLYQPVGRYRVDKNAGKWRNDEQKNPLENIETVDCLIQCPRKNAVCTSRIDLHRYDTRNQFLQDI